MAAQQFTPWQKMRAYETQVRKIEDYWKNIERNKKKLKEAGQGEEDENVIVAEPFEPCCKEPLTYYNNGKCNNCGKTQYDYNFSFCDGYDQYRHREDRKHSHRYMHIDLEEQYPCRTVPLCTNSNYGHRPPYDTMRARPKNHSTETFFRSRGTYYTMNANENGTTVKLNPTTSFKWNAQYGYTYSPPRN